MDSNLDNAAVQFPQPENFRAKVDRILGKQRLTLHLVLFLLAFFTTTVSGVSWRGLSHDWTDLADLHFGLEYATLILGFLTAHEFGHFIAARIHDVDATLPFYIPFPGYVYSAINFGTLGAVIRTRSRIPSNKVMFDIGVAGPIAGFVVCVIMLAIGFATLPGIEYLQQIHPGFPNEPHLPGTIELAFGNTLFFSGMKALFLNPSGYMPPMTEVYHYPMLCAGWFGLFVTALNLLPVGQLDGGHLIYTLFGKKLHGIIGPITGFVLFGISVPAILVGYIDNCPAWLQAIAVPGGETWFLWAILTTLVIRFRHPPTLDESPLDLRRKMIGYATLVIFVLCFTPSPLLVQ